MWNPATANHTPLIQAAFQEFRAQRKNHYVSYLAEPGIVDFHSERILQRLQNSSAKSPLFVYESAHGLLAITGIEANAWHSEHFGVPYYKITPFFCFTENLEENTQIAKSLDSLCTRTGALYTLRLESHQHALIYPLNHLGYQYVGTSLRLAMDLHSKEIVDSSSGKPYDTYTIRPFREADLPILQDIIRRSHRHSHFFQEMRFNPNQCRELFAEWIRRCTVNPSYKIQVAENEDSVIGFCSVLIQKSLKPYIQRSIGIIDFIAVDYAIQGKGIGGALLQTAKDWFLSSGADLVELRTMADNLQAIRFYEKNGFRMLSSDHHFHRWT